MMANQMTAAVLYGKEDLRIEQVPVPSAGPGEIVVSVAAALTCGTDLKVYRRGYHAKMLKPPILFGHELAGVVVEVGEGVSKFRVGDRVVALNSAPCDVCYYCKHDQQNLCDDLLFNNGAYAEYIRIPAQIARYNTYHIPDHVPFEIAAFCEPLAVCLHGLHQAHISPGDRVAVMGLGPIGQLMTRAAKLKGAHVTTLARNPHKLALAQNFGQADAIVNLAETPAAEDIRQLATPDGRGFDVVIEAIGTPETWEKAIALVRKGGTANLFGGCKGGTSIQLDTRRLHYDEIKLVSSFHHTPHHFKAALDLLSSMQIDPRALITDILPMARFESALQQVEAGQAMKIVLKNQWD